ncbi:hypothetical protein AKJ09_07244 [Labilithrix luteola]|uniref:Uncharacterized protein n=1 Tax=Labilithrix luteola TaxID=1391654 RepID=A0A0K1Q423_9BACT|nr:hypothetical protein [Labilithrix luteola]AKV00581.1 hypothetical protein AKJ09_07244 [Labilithrix luteola]
MRTKGVAVRSILLGVETLWGPSGLERVKDALAPEIRSQIEPLVLSADWYDVTVPAAIHVAVKETVGNGSWRYSRDIGREAGRVDWKGVHRIFLRAFSYDTIFERVERAWRQYQSQGVVTWKRYGDTRASGIVTDVQGLNEGIWLSVAGRLEVLFEFAGAKTSLCELVRFTSNDAVFDLAWKKS